MVKLVCKIVGFFLLFGFFLAFLGSVTAKDILGWCGRVGGVIVETLSDFLPDWMASDDEEKEEKKEDETPQEEEKKEEQENITRTIQYYIVTVEQLNVSVNEQKQQMAGMQQAANSAIASGNAQVIQQNYMEMNQIRVQIEQLLSQVNNVENNLYNVQNTTNNLTRVDVNNINASLKTMNRLKVELNDLHTENRNTIVKIQQVLQAQEKEENKECHYAIGSEEALLESGVISKGLLGRLRVEESGYTSSFYIPGKVSELTRIELHAKKAEVLSDMPSDSYQLRAINSFLILVVTDEKKFWSKTSYLVVKTE